MAQLMGESSSAAKILIQITARMGDHNAFVASNQAIGDLTGLSLATVKRSLKLLQDRKWINVLRLGPTGTVRVIVVNDQVAWFGPRDGLRHSLFSAAVFVSEAEQDALEMRGNGPMHELPAIYRGELQLPTGDGLPPPSEPSLPGMEPDLPASREPSARQPMGEAANLGTLVSGIAGKLADRG
ncbi:replication/maintenance protein RepL [Sphingomonas jatrophae]|nr:replication/maintenance protein RepL [Sphingomonas jatrophae]